MSEIASAPSRSLEVANTIKDQLGHRALFMLGAQNLVGGDKGLSFKIRGSKTVSHIRINLEDTDTYKVEFLKIRKFEVKTVATVSDCYVGGLHRTIEQFTGLRTSL